MLIYCTWCSIMSVAGQLRIADVKSEHIFPAPTIPHLVASPEYRIHHNISLQLKYCTKKLQIFSSFNNNS